MKLGDELLVTRPGAYNYSPPQYSHEVVASDTPTQWVTNGGTHIRKRDGYPLGVVTVEPFDSERWQRIQDCRERLRLVRVLHEADYTGVNLEVLREVVRALAPEFARVRSGL